MYVNIPRPFKFESAWLVDDFYLDNLRRSWNRDASMVDDMDRAKEFLQSWKGNSFGQVLKKKKECLAHLNGVQGCIQRNDKFLGMKTLEKKLHLELNFILKQGEIMWRTKWLVDGDRNTKYYHLKTINRR